MSNTNELTEKIKAVLLGLSLVIVSEFREFYDREDL
jgi:hypothetical protein